MVCEYEKWSVVFSYCGYSSFTLFQYAYTCSASCEVLTVVMFGLSIKNRFVYLFPEVFIMRIVVSRFMASCSLIGCYGSFGGTHRLQL